jgi:hypothetical protein
VVEAFRLPDADEQGTEIGQPGGLRVDALPARLDRNRAATTDTDVEVQPVFDDLGIWDYQESDARPVAVGVADPVCAGTQFLLGYLEVAVVVVPGRETSRGRR